MKHLTIPQLTTAFFTGCIAYPLLEVAYRGYSHWTMSLTGGLCLVMLFLIQWAFPDLTVWRKALLGALTIVTLELMVGSAANLWLGWAIWDYTDLRFHYLGQISLGFALIWYCLCSLFFGIAGWICTGAKKREPRMRLSSFRIAGAPQGAALEKIKLRKPFRRPCR
ncbi:MAG: hypothetical protein IKD13_04625 [Firmicutes bacterium]|nr:hypothetical protein [Bacillota bacterium]